jgi:outer membrane protein insertion porin family
MLHGQAGYLREGRDKGLPTYQKYMIGGMNSVRGYDWYDISPQDIDGATIGGEKMMTLNFEFAFPLLGDQGLYGVTFYDLGNVWGNENWDPASKQYKRDNAYRIDDLYRSVGAGIRYLSPLGPIRLEYGKPVGKLPPGCGGNSGQWEFTMGSMF